VGKSNFESAKNARENQEREKPKKNQSERAETEKEIRHEIASKYMLVERQEGRANRSQLGSGTVVPP
jgi:hypothetical protein